MLQCSPGQRRHRYPAQGCHCLCRRRCHPPAPPLPLPSTCSVRISDRHKSPVASSIHHTPLSQQNWSSLSVCKIFYLHIFLILILHCILRLVSGDFCSTQTGSTCAAAVAGEKPGGDCVREMAIKHTLITLQQPPLTSSLRFTIFSFYL